MSNGIVGVILLAAAGSLIMMPGCIDVHHDHGPDHPEEVRHVDVHEDVHHEDVHPGDVHHDDHVDYDR